MIAYYAHSHGNGHCNYASQLATTNCFKTIILTDSSFQFESYHKVVPLPSENTDGTEFDRQTFPTPNYLHYAPINVTNILRRNQSILTACAAYGIRLLIVDVSVEVAALARVSSIPYAYIKMMGDRNDRAHLNAYEGAMFLIAYYPEALESNSTPDWVRNKTKYLGFIKTKKEVEKKIITSDPKYKADILVLQGAGGNAVNHDFLQKLSSYYTNQKIKVVGKIENVSDFGNVHVVGMVPDTEPYIKNANKIIASCGSNTTSEILSQGKKFFILAEERPFKEQQQFAEALERNELGVRFDINTIRTAEQKMALFSRIIPSFAIPHGLQDFQNWMQECAYDPSIMTSNIRNRALVKNSLKKEVPKTEIVSIKKPKNKVSYATV